MNDLITLLKALIMGFATGFVISIPLGPAGIESIKRTISKSFREGFTVSLGALSADVTYLLLINCGLSNLLSKNKKTESIFWIISGFILLLIGYLSLKEKKHSMLNIDIFKLNRFNSLPFLSGFLITFSNPMTPTLWLTLSGTAIRAWYYAGTVYYYTFIFSIISGMVFWFFLLNYAAYKGKHVFNLTSTDKASNLLKYIIIIIGAGFVLFGFFRLIYCLAV